ncbi:MAG: cell division protein ZapE, partial [Pseudomonadota bacterium]
VIVATSNVAPGDLYSDGLNRDLFLPFIDVLQAQMEIVSVDGEVDHRLRALEGRSTYFAPLGPAADTQMRGLWQDLTGTEYGQPATLAIAGRQIAIPHAHGRAAMGDFGDWFDFDGWSGQALGASDYLVMVEAYEWIFVRNVPVMGPDKNNAARRFVTFIDAVYDVGRQVVITAEAEPSDLYVHGPGANLFERTASRLIEMRVANPADIDARYKQSRTQALREKPWAMPPV